MRQDCSRPSLRPVPQAASQILSGRICLRSDLAPRMRRGQSARCGVDDGERGVGEAAAGALAL
jgi:hypothetical protein